MSAVLQGGIQSPLLGTLVITVAALLFGFVSIGRPPSIRKMAIMALPMVLLAILLRSGSGHVILVVAVLVAAVGEALLAEGRASAWFAGLGAFLAVRVIYAVLFVLAADPALYSGGLWRFAGAAVAVVVIGSVLLRSWRYAGPLRWPAALYMLSLAVMCAAAAAILQPAVFGGAILLAAADLALASGRFRLPSDADVAPPLRGLIWLGRYLGQALIVLAALGLA